MSDSLLAGDYCPGCGRVAIEADVPELIIDDEGFSWHRACYEDWCAKWPEDCVPSAP